MFKKLFFDSAKGLGDAFVFNGIVHHYARDCETLYYPAKAEFFETLTCLYQDFPNIEVWRFYDPSQEEIFMKTFPDVVRVNSLPLVATELQRQDCAPEWIHVHWQQQIYDNFDIPYKMRYLDFHMPKHVEGSDKLYNRMTQGESDYILVHRYASDIPMGIPLDIPKFRESRGLTPIKVIEIGAGQTTNMLEYKKLIENAKEIHCISSSFYNLVDSMVNSTKAELFFHDIRKNTLMQVNTRWNNNRWIIIGYKQRV